jgi:hypothetical protein
MPLGILMMRGHPTVTNIPLHATIGQTCYNFQAFYSPFIESYREAAAILDPPPMPLLIPYTVKKSDRPWIAIAQKMLLKY